MGIGRFAFTPMLPLMQAEETLTLAQGSYLASANYMGYLLGALLCFAISPSPLHAALYGLLAVAVSTLAMAWTASLALWVVARLVAGIASAFVLIGVSTWALGELPARGRAVWSGLVFAGVGIGIMAAGGVALATGVARGTPSAGWLALGLVALAATLPFLRADAGGVSAPRSAWQGAAGLGRTAWRLVVCYGAFGLGYIIPATFLPAAARDLIAEPAVFGWAWPVFGFAAAASTVAVATLLGSVPPRMVWALGHAVMALGVALPALAPTPLAIVISALCVGGTFMVITMTGMQEARRVGGPAASRLMAAMTAAFATGQLAGPLLVTGTGPAVQAIRVPSLAAAAILVLAAIALLPGSAGSTATGRAASAKE
jgi:MFS family permease